MKRAFNDLQKRWNDGDRGSRILAVVQAFVLCLIVLVLAVWGATADVIIGMVVWIFGIAVIQAKRGIKNDNVDFKVFLDWFVLDLLLALSDGSFWFC